MCLLLVTTVLIKKLVDLLKRQRVQVVAITKGSHQLNKLWILIPEI
jgi:hypothetical protein